MPRSRLNRTSFRRTLIVCGDLAIAIASFVAAYVVAYGWERVGFVPGLEEKTMAFGAVAFVSLFVSSVHRGSWRYFSIPELLALIKAAVLATCAYTLAAFLISRGDNVPRSVPVLTGLFMVTGMSGVRLTYRLMMDGSWVRHISPGRKPIRRGMILFGFTQEAEVFIRASRRSAGSPVEVVGILDDSPANYSRSVQGVTVYGGLADLDSVVRRLRRRASVDELAVADGTLNQQKLRQILNAAAAVGLKVSRIPDLTNTATITNTFLLEPKPINLGDLLGRPEVKFDFDVIAQFTSRRIVLVTGAGGSIGSELCRQIALFDPEQLIITDSMEHHLYEIDKKIRTKHPKLPVVTRIVDVRDAARVKKTVAEFRPDVVFHAAALKHVPLVEENPLEGIKTNLLGTRNVADAAIASDASIFVMISTDKAVNPTSVMGATKRAAEMYCQGLDVISDKTTFKTVRFGNVLESNGSVIPLFREQIAAGGPVTVTHPQVTRYFMTIPEAVRLVLHAAGHELKRQDGDLGSILVLNMGEPVRIVDLAERMIQLAGFIPNKDIEIIFTGLRPGEKLFEELLDPCEDCDHVATGAGYMVASPRIVDNVLLDRVLAAIEEAVGREDVSRAMQLLRHLVPEYRKRGENGSAFPGRSSDRPNKTDSAPADFSSL